MTTPVTLPLWLLVLILLFAAVTFASHFLFPSVRWFFRKRMERAVERINQKLARPISPFKLATRYDTIQRLLYDPKVAQAIRDHARAEGVPDNVAFELAKKYAREIVPSFSASVYFSIGARLAKWLSKLIYRIKLGQIDEDVLDSIDGESTVVFVINHRSNMDYVLITYLFSRASTVAYAVGEWARVWPLSWLVRAMGAYFIRRGKKGPLYNAVLSRYVGMATEAGVTQAFFPEGGLSLDGRLGKPKLGLLHNIVEGRPEDERDVVFVPVALNYDRVMEDNVLLRAAHKGERRFRPPLFQALMAIPLYLWRALRLKFTPFGTASVAFGRPVFLSQFLTETHDDPIAALADRVMEQVAGAVPLVPVPLVARALENGATTRAQVHEHVNGDLKYAGERGLRLPSRDADSLAESGLALLEARKLIAFNSEEIEVLSERSGLITYYATSVKHHFAADAQENKGNSAFAK